jgi:uncharacterized membrane protein (DUF485 family)
MEIKSLLKSKVILFFIQFLVLSLFIYFFNYNFEIDFDSGILEERRIIIQFLSNYVWYNPNSAIYFVYLVWLITSLIPIFILNDLKKSASLNITTFFLPNFFSYVFLSRYSPNYFNANFLNLFTKTIILGIFILVLSIGLSYILKVCTKNKEEQKVDIEVIANLNKITCPNCGTEFNSIPKFCYKCNTLLEKGS